MILQTDSYNTQILESSNLQAGHKHEIQGSWKIVKISGKTRGIFLFLQKNLENSGKM